ncbi:MAG: hypothetical protein JRG92_01615 [Deltaproteobacteria bacterium]|nr:hypothetical protein [Deltaproteobacteria bacterium]MBW2382295.1 hypothetical protein [Deltaproteobacteria bacterium]
MRSLVVLSMLITTVVTLTVGVRLLLAARRTRQIPELLYGTAFVATAVGQVFPQIGQRLLWSDPGVLATTLNTLFFGIFVLGSLALWNVTSKVFRPGDEWAKWLCWMGCLATLAAYGLRIVDGDFAVSVAPSRGLLAHYAIRILLLGWVCFEAFRWHALLRRRLKLGLADPVATNQILLWGISGVAAVVPALVIVLSLFVLHVHPLEWWPALSAIMLSVFVVSGGMWCAFFPPAWLRTSLEQRALG